MKHIIILFSFTWVALFCWFNERALAEDTNAPQITAFSISPTTINTETSDQILTLSVTLTDDLSGVCISGDCGSYYNSSPTQMRFVPASGGMQMVDFYNFTRTSGDSLNGTYSATATIPKGSAIGVWEVSHFLLVDQLGNITYKYKTDLETQFGAGSTEVQNIGSVEDVTAPQITAFNITPIQFNTETSDQILTLSVTLTDDLSGVCISGDCGSYYNGSPTQLRIRPLIGTQMVDFYNFTRTSGDSLNGTYTATATIPAHAKEGVWEVVSFLLVDQLGNWKFLSTNDLNTQFGGGSLTLANTAEALSVRVEREWTFSSEIASVTFSLDTVVTRKQGGNFAFYEMVNQEVELNDVPVTPPSGKSLKILKFGIPGIGLEFDHPVHIVLKVGEEYNGNELKVLTLVEGGSNWSKENNCIVNQGNCSFNVTHASYFTTEIIDDSPRTMFPPAILLLFE